MDPDTVPSIITAATQSIVNNAQELGLTWTIRIATVTAAARTPLSTKAVSAIFDGDSNAITMTNMTGQVLPVGARVYVLLIAQQGNFIVGFNEVMPKIGSKGNRGLSAQALPHNTPTLVQWDQIILDTSGFAPITLPGTTLTIPTGLDGIYAITASMNITASGVRNFLGINVNGTRTVRMSFDQGEDYTSVSGTIDLIAGNGVTIEAFQQSGALAAMIGSYWFFRIG